MKEFVEKLIERLEELKADAINEDCPVVPNSEDCEMEYSCTSCFLNETIKIVNQLAEEYKSNLSGNSIGWIPVEERLPDDKCPVIVCATGKEEGVFISYYVEDVEKWKYDTEEGISHYVNVIAWQPLPKPYEPEEQKKIPTDHYEERFNRVM